MAFYGDLDFLPTEQYTRDDARKAMTDADAVVGAVHAWIRQKRPPA